jgi:uncharacterized protein YjbI with pentapeptide repeats
MTEQRHVHNGGNCALLDEVSGYNDCSVIETSNGETRMNDTAPQQLSSRAEVQKALKKKRDLSGTDLSGLDLAGLKFTGLNAEGIDLSNSNFPRGIIMAANLQGADLSGANLAGAVFGMSNLDKASLRGANLRGAKFQMCNLGDVDFSEANLSDSLWIASNVADADFSDAQMEGAKSTAVTWQTAATLPAPLPEPLLPTPRWAPFAVLGLLGSLLTLFFLRRRQSR